MPSVSPSSTCATRRSSSEASFTQPRLVERYAEKAAALQDLLGERNDATIALRLIHTLDFRSDAQFAYAAGVAAGWRARGGLGEEPALRKAWRSLRRAEPFWRGEDARPRRRIGCEPQASGESGHGRKDANP